MHAVAKNNALRLLQTSNIITNPSYFSTTHGPGCIAELASATSNVALYENLHRAGVIDGSVQVIANTFLNGPAQRYYSSPINWFAFTNTLTSVYPAIDSCTFPLQSNVEFVNSPLEANPELSVAIYDAQRKCIAHTLLCGKNSKITPPVSDSWKKFVPQVSEQGVEKSDTNCQCTIESLITDTKLNANNKVECSFTVPHGFCNPERENTSFMPRYILLDLIHSFTEKALRMLDKKDPHLKPFQNKHLRYIAGDFDAILMHENFRIETFHDREMCALPRIGVPIHVEAEIPRVHTFTQTPIWMASVGLPHLSTNTPCIMIAVSIKQNDFTVTKGKFYFIPFRVM